MTKAQRPPKVRRSKYGAKRTVYNGVAYASEAEAKYARWLDGAVSDGHVHWYLRQPRFQLGLPQNVYVADFLVILKSGRVYAVDVKGMETDKFRRDMRLWEEYGPCDISIVKNGHIDTVVVGGGKRVRIEDANQAK